MQTPTTIKRFNLGQFKVAALAVGIAASVVVGAVTFNATRGDEAAVPSSRPAAAAASGQVDFIVQNALQPEAAPAAQVVHSRPSVAVKPVVLRGGMSEWYQARRSVAPNDIVLRGGMYETDHFADLAAPSTVILRGGMYEAYHVRDQNVLPGDDVYTLPVGAAGESY